MRFISCCIAELVSRTERRTLTAAYKELSSGAIAIKLRTTAGPPTYRKPVDAFRGVNLRTPVGERSDTYQMHLQGFTRVQINGLNFIINLPKCPTRAAPMVRAGPFRCWLMFWARKTGVESSRDVIPICKKTQRLPLCIKTTDCFSVDALYLFSNKSAVHLIVILSDLHNSCYRRNCWIDAKWNPLLRNNPARQRLNIWITAWKKQRGETIHVSKREL